MATRKNKTATQSDDLNSNPIDGTFEDTASNENTTHDDNTVPDSDDGTTSPAIVSNPTPVANPHNKAIVTDVFRTTLTLTFATGQSLAVDVSKLSPDMLMQAAIHGVKQKLVDAAAVTRSTITGLSVSPQEKFALVEEVFDRITHPTAPSWNKERGSGEGVSSGGGYLVAALVEQSGKPHAVIKAWVDTLDGKQKAALRADPSIAPIIARLQSTVKPKAESSSLLAALQDLN